MKLKVRTLIPALLNVVSPIIKAKAGAIYTFSLDITALRTSFDPLYAAIANNLSDLAVKYTAKDNISIHGADIASASTINLETATGDLVDVTGTTTITAITLSEGHERTVRFTGILTLTNGASLVNITGANIATAAGDFAVFRGYAAGVVRMIGYERASGFALAAGAGVSSIAGNTGAFTLANGIDNSTNSIQLTAARRTLPTTQVFTSSSGTYTTPANCLWIEVELVGGGGGGAGSGTTPGAAGNGGNTTFSTLTGSGGGAASTALGGAGGAAAGGFVNKAGIAGQNGSGVNNTTGGNGGVSPYGGTGWGGAAGAGAGVAGGTNSGSGGGGGGVNVTVNGGGGGGSGGFVRAIINSPAATYSYAVGAAGTAGTAGGGGANGAAGGSGFIQVTEHYGS
jgi:hypothetical protein